MELSNCTSKNTASLLPYLKGGNPENRLVLSLFHEFKTCNDRTYPFFVVDESDATSMLVEARFITDNGNLLKRVFLQVEKDHYSLRENDLTLATNVDIDNSWLKAFQSYELQTDKSTFLLPQKDICNQPQRLTSLFYCREKSLFFHPVCPSCGSNLQLCVNDQLLQKKGLKPYTLTSKRYLYCTSCSILGDSEFYLFERESSDPVSVKDRWALIDEFQLVDNVKDPDKLFPCTRCSDRHFCYGPEKVAKSRIVPFSFYPFYMLIYDAPSLNITDFLHLGSGADCDELVSHLDSGSSSARVYCLSKIGLQGASLLPIFPAEDDRSFLEVLFLKISVLQSVLRKRLLFKPDMNESIKSENMWVNLSTHENQISIFLDFSITVLNSVSPDIQNQWLSGRASNIFSSLGLFWFELLLKNSEIDKNDIGYSVKQYLSRRLKGTLSNGNPSALDDISIPRNIFWLPGQKEIRQEWKPFWKRTCDLGLILLNNSYDHDEAFTWDAFNIYIDELRTDIKSSLFFVDSLSSKLVADTKPVLDDDILLQIVNKVIRRYRENNSAQSVVLAEVEDDEDAATVIIPAGSNMFRVEDEVITETVMLTSSRCDRPDISVQKPASCENSGLAETVILTREDCSASQDNGGGNTINGPVAHVADEQEIDLLGETVVIQAPIGKQRSRGGSFSN